MQINSQWNITLNLVVLGSTGIGKSSLLLTFRDGIMPTDIKPGLINVYWSSADFAIKTEVHGKKCNVFCKDTRLLEASEDRREVLKKFDGSHVLLCCFSYDDRSSFEYLEKLPTELFTYVSKLPPILIVGLKSDADTANITVAELEKLKKDYSAKNINNCEVYGGVSAKTNTKGVNELYKRATDSALKFAQKVGQVPEDKIIPTETNDNNNKKKGCCEIF